MLGNGVSVSIHTRGLNRIKSGRKEGESRSYDFEAIAKYFDKPLAKAAASLNISPTALKILCRKLGIQKWPYQRRTLNHGLNPEAVGSSPSFLEQQINNGLNPPSSSEHSRAGTTLPFNQSVDDSVGGDDYAKNNGEEDATLGNHMSAIDGIFDKDSSLPFSDVLGESRFLGPDQDEGVPISNSSQYLIDASGRGACGIHDDVAPILIEDSDDDSSQVDFTFSSLDQEKKKMKKEPFAVQSSATFDLNTAEDLEKFLCLHNENAFNLLQECGSDN